MIGGEPEPPSRPGRRRRARRRHLPRRSRRAAGAIRPRRPPRRSCRPAATQRPVMPPGSSPIPGHGRRAADAAGAAGASNVPVPPPPEPPPPAPAPPAAPPPAAAAPAAPRHAGRAAAPATPRGSRSARRAKCASAADRTPFRSRSPARRALSTLTLSITYNPALIRVRSVQEGTFMRQGGVTPAFSSQIDDKSGRIDIVDHAARRSRPARRRRVCSRRSCSSRSRPGTGSLGGHRVRPRVPGGARGAAAVPARRGSRCGDDRRMRIRERRSEASRSSSCWSSRRSC